MNNKKVIILCILVFLIIIIVLICNKKVFVKDNNLNKLENMEEIQYDEETSLYYIKDKETGKIISASKSKNDLEIYIDNPDYNLNPLAPQKENLEDYLLEELIIEN